ncbi:NACHT domain-containing protein [Nocardiopsis mangrovi]|uniref:NACHT domain-containing protein n=1 Tax=Nocardiopsis mangrovi TaxID=1179818 RepID=A0ABV9E2J9_9ACTN
MIDPALRLGAAVVGTACRLWIGDIPFATDVTASVTDLIRTRVSGVLERRRLERRFEDFQEEIAKRVLDHLEHEFRGLPDNEREAAVLAVADTFERADLDNRALFEQDLDPLFLERHLRRWTPRITRDLGSAAVGVYDRVLPECCAYVMATLKTLPDFHAEAFTELLRRDRIILDQLAEILDRLPRAGAEEDATDATEAAFVTAYRRKAAERWDVLELFGTDAHTRAYPLTVAYLSLNVSFPSSFADADTDADSRSIGWERRRGGVQRVEEALSGADRLFLRGPAGAGKTTLLHWLAVRASREDFPDELASWRGLIPFVIPLRRYVDQDLPEPEEFIRTTGRHLAAEAPRGWIHRVLDAGRAVLLVDGVDELPGPQRENARRWLRDLVRDYPRCRFVVTSRPAAAGEDWLAREDFVSAELEPLRDADISAFIRSWYEAVRSDTADAEARERLTVYERELTEKVLAQRHLSGIASTPLLCALLCALYRDRRTALPRDRMEVYEAALSMLLKERDEQRGIHVEGARLSRTEKILLLQELAKWLVLNGATDAPHDVARRRIEHIAASLHRAGGDPDEVFDHLVVRSGLLTSPAVDRVSFIHRTFEEYLAAKALVEDDSLPMLVNHAHDDQWREVVVMAAGHARPQQREELIRGLLDRADQDGPHGDLLLTVAFACLETSPLLSPGLRDEVERRVAGILPPRTDEQVSALIAMGEPALRLLADTPIRDATEAVNTVETASGIGGAASIPIIARAARFDDRRAWNAVEDAWHADPSAEFAQQVFPHRPHDRHEFISPAVLFPLVSEYMPNITLLQLTGGGTTGLHGLHGLGALRVLALHSQRDDAWHVDLAPLKGMRPTVVLLSLAGATTTGSITPAAGHPLEQLILRGARRVHDVETLATFPLLHSLHMADELPLPPLSRVLPVGRPLQHLVLARIEEHTDLRVLADVEHGVRRLSLDDWPHLGSLAGIESVADRLTSLDCINSRSVARDPTDLGALVSAAKLTRLRLSEAIADANVHVLAALSALAELEIVYSGIRRPARSVAEIPGLRTLWLSGRGPVDIRDVAGIPDLTIVAPGVVPSEVAGANLLGPGSELVVDPTVLPRAG